ncbi:hypothetical protein EYF80_049553 [Liparis tanakae]|uniref:Uncharacterized protein n=1 Tax=Liparis tanakae TaxID=230148 RepID=A0A4Z2FGB6_9TELE|nr:hypothetical protein EYF80_049553 [Liparis tanakae]
MEAANERKGSKYEDMEEEEELPVVERPGLSGGGGGSGKMLWMGLDQWKRESVGVKSSNLGSPA